MSASKSRFPIHLQSEKQLKAVKRGEQPMYCTGDAIKKTDHYKCLATTENRAEYIFLIQHAG